MRRHGAVLVFKKGTSKKQAEAALRRVKDVIDPNYYADPARLVNEFEDDHGGPVWYIP
jgi:hypothetical protein